MRLRKLLKGIIVYFKTKIPGKQLIKGFFPIIADCVREHFQYDPLLWIPAGLITTLSAMDNFIS